MADSVKLPPPQKDNDFQLMAALENRRSKRKWRDEPLSGQQLSDLLWAACGVTKEETKSSKSRRTAPSACNSQEIKVYVAREDGVFLYDERNHRLIKYISDDIRTHIGTQKMMRLAPVGLIYVSDYSKLNSPFFKAEDKKLFTSAADTGFISQNVYLYCAAANLNTVILGLVDRDKLHKIMRLKKYEKIIYTQVVGKPPEQ